MIKNIYWVSEFSYFYIHTNQHAIMKKILFSACIVFLSFSVVMGQEEGYQFKMKYEVKATPVKSQNRTSTCWSFSAISFFESEMIRNGMEEIDLSEMFIVRNTYIGKAKQYARMHGNVNFAGGGAFHDALNVMRDHGLMLESDYPGLNYGEKAHMHGEMDAVLAGYMEGLIKNRNRKLSTAWMKGFNGILDAYLGPQPKEVTYKGEKHTAVKVREALGLDPDDYVILSSFTHHPYYEPFILEVPDNWAWGSCYNLPLEEFREVLDHALTNGFSIAWASDVSDPGWNSKNGIAIVPEKEWSEIGEKEKEKFFVTPVKQMSVTAAMRQLAFDNYSTTDDHGMHIIGMGYDQGGNKFFKVKNSWGSYGPYDGYHYVSEAFILLKTTNYMVHKDGIPEAIRDKIGIK